jgi:predicted TIM-barrel fold metal-dependent hydrolase
MTTLIHAASDDSVTETLRHLETIHATIGVLNHVNKRFMPLLKEEEKLIKIGQRLYIQTPYEHQVASKRMRMIANIPHTIRWVNDLCFTVPGNPDPIKFKKYVTRRHPTTWWAS